MSAIVKWHNIKYLQSEGHSAYGPEVAQRLFDTLRENSIIEKVKIYLPILVGGHAVGLADPEKSVRIVCEVYALESFHTCAEREFKEFGRFQVVEKSIGGKPALVVRFKCGPFHIEIIGQPMPVEEQILFRATVAADRLLGGVEDPPAFKRELQTLASHLRSPFELVGRAFQVKKPQGVKWDELLANLADISDEKMEQYCQQATVPVVSPPVDVSCADNSAAAANPAS